MDERERLLAVLDGKTAERPPVICPGGMMSMVCRDVGEKSSPLWLAAHKDAATMARVSRDLHVATGFENYGVPFCMTVEAEALGSEIDFGGLDVEPRVTRSVLETPGKLSALKFGGPPTAGRMPVVLQAISILKRSQNGTPIIGAVTGPVSLSCSLMDTDQFMRLVIKDKKFVRELMALSTEVIASFAEAQAEAGAEVISIGDPTASGEILGPRFFDEFVGPSLQTIVRRIKAKGARVILHICGNTESILGSLRSTGADALSFDACMSIKNVRNTVGEWNLMGNVSTFLLAQGTMPSITRMTERVIEEGVDIVSPACGLSTGTLAAHVRAMTDAVRGRSAITG